MRTGTCPVLTLYRVLWTYLDSVSVCWQKEGQIEVNIGNFVLLLKRKLVGCEYGPVEEHFPDTCEPQVQFPAQKTKQATTTTTIRN